MTRYLFQKEAQTLRLVGHPNVVRLYDYFEEEDSFFILLEYCPTESYKQIIDKSGPFPLYRLRTTFKELFEALKYFHGMNICHRDIKPANMAYDKQNRAKLLDWGYSTQFKEGELLDSYCGSMPYTPPECLKRVPYDGRKADIWSMGVTMYVCAFGKDPWNMKEELHQAKDRILTGKVTFDEQADTDLCDLILRLLKLDPNERLSADEALSHPFFEITSATTTPRSPSWRRLTHHAGAPHVLPRNTRAVAKAILRA